MYLLDVNVVLAVHRGDHPHHLPVRSWFDQMIVDALQFAVPVGIWASFLRLATNRRIFTVPTPLHDAWAFIDAVTTQPSYLLLRPGPRHLAVLRGLCAEGGAIGDLVPDAAIAAVAAEHGCAVATLDRDFARFPSVRHVLVPTR
jgi:toxin-antitoxin system PIN domain toxin